MNNYLMQGRFARNPVLGCGIKYPFEFSQKTGSTLWEVATSEAETLINGEITQLLSTRCAVGNIPGEDEALPTFGSQLYAYVGEKLGKAMRAVIMGLVIDAIETWIKRIQLGPVTFLSSAIDQAIGGNTAPEVVAACEQIEQGIERVYIPYTIIETQQPGNCVYPFYLNRDLTIQGYGYVYPMKGK